MKFKRPSHDTVKRAAAFALVVLALYLIISTLDLARDNGKMAIENAERADRANEQIDKLLKSNKKQSNQLDTAQDTLDTLLVQNRALVRQLRQAGLDPIFDEEDLGNADAKPNRSNNQGGATSPSSPNSGSSSSTSSPQGDDDTNNSPKPRPPRDKPDKPDDDGGGGEEQGPIDDTIDTVEDVLCGLIPCSREESLLVGLWVPMWQAWLW